MGQSVVNRPLMPAPLHQLPAVCPSLRCCGPALAAGVVRCAPGGRPARRPPEQPALACGGGCEARPIGTRARCEEMLARGAREKWFIFPILLQLCGGWGVSKSVMAGHAKPGKRGEVSVSVAYSVAARCSARSWRRYTSILRCCQSTIQYSLTPRRE